MSTMMYCEGLPMTLENNFQITTGTSAIISGTILTITTSGNHTFVFTQELPTACTMEYAPVCGKVAVQCITTPCPAVDQTFGNMCTAQAAGATDITAGECATGPIVGWDSDEHGCKASAWYSRSTGLQQCIRIWEFEWALDFAIQHKITAMKTVKSFRGNDNVTRQEAAKMLVSFAENLYNKSYASFPKNCNKRYKDDKTIAFWLKNSVYDACALGLMNGRNGSFHPYAGLTRGQALMVLMKIVDGNQPSGTPYYMPYAYRANELWLWDIWSIEWLDKLITRSELITWMKDLYTKQQDANHMYTTAQKNLDAAKAVWNIQKMSNYTVTRTISCFCGPDYTLPMSYQVINNSIDATTLIYADGGSKVTMEWIELQRVEDMFAMIQEAIDSKAESITVSYDTTLWYPTSLSIDRSKMIADEEMYYTFSIK